MTTQALIEKYRLSPKDVGSSQVQIIRMTEEIRVLTQHVTSNPKDVHSRRGLLRKVSKRKSLLNYLSKQKHTLYKQLIADLGIRN